MTVNAEMATALSSFGSLTDEDAPQNINGMLDSVRGYRGAR